MGCSACLPLDACVVDDQVYLVCRDAWPQRRGCEVKDLSCHAANVAHLLLGRGIEKLDFVQPHQFILAFGDPIDGPVRGRYGLGNLPWRGQRVYRPEVTCVAESREWVEMAVSYIELSVSRVYGRDTAGQFTILFLMNRLVSFLRTSVRASKA